MATKKQKKEETAPLIQWEDSETGEIGKIGGVKHFEILDDGGDFIKLRSDASMLDDYWQEGFSDNGVYPANDNVQELAEKIARRIVTNPHNAEKKTEEAYRMKNEVSTSLGSKECEPMIVRKFMYPGGFPLYVGLICGANLDNLDDVVLKFMEANLSRIESKSIQDKRNVAGELTVLLCKTYGRKSEGVAVLWYVDKMFISSLWGDFMVHFPCKMELYQIIGVLPHI